MTLSSGSLGVKRTSISTPPLLWQKSVIVTRNLSPCFCSQTSETPSTAFMVSRDDGLRKEEGWREGGRETDRQRKEGKEREKGAIREENKILQYNSGHTLPELG